MTFQKGITIIFILYALVSGFLAYVNYRGGYLNDDTIVTYLDYVALSNAYGFKNATSNTTASTWPTDNKMWALLYYYFDFGTTIYLLISLLVMKNYLQTIAKDIFKSRIHP